MSGPEELREARLSLSPPAFPSLAGSAPGSADVFERARKNLKSAAPLLDSHRYARPVGKWIDQPELEGTDKLATNLKGFHGTFVKLQQARTFLHNATPAECEATIATLVELDGLTEKQGQQLKEELELEDDEIEKITVVASYEFKEGDRRGSLEFHSDGGAIMSTTAGKQTWSFAFSEIGELDDGGALDDAATVLQLQGTCVSEHAIEGEETLQATFELKEDCGGWRGMIGGPDGCAVQRWEAWLSPSSDMWMLDGESSKWFFLDANLLQARGPCTSGMLREELSAGRIQPTVLVWSRGLGKGLDADGSMQVGVWAPLNSLLPMCKVLNIKPAASGGDISGDLDGIGAVDNSGTGSPTSPIPAAPLADTLEMPPISPQAVAQVDRRRTPSTSSIGGTLPMPAHLQAEFEQAMQRELEQPLQPASVGRPSLAPPTPYQVAERAVDKAAARRLSSDEINNLLLETALLLS